MLYFHTTIPIRSINRKLNAIEEKILEETMECETDNEALVLVSEHPSPGH